MPKDNLTDIINMFTTIGLKVIPFIGSLAFLVFVFGIVRFIKSAGEGDIKKSKEFIIWGVIGMFVLATIWGIIAFARGEFGFGGGEFGIPQIQIK